MYRGLIIELPRVEVHGSIITINNKPYRKALTKIGAKAIASIVSKSIDKRFDFLIKAQVLNIKDDKVEIKLPVFDTEFYGLHQTYIMANGKHIRTTKRDKAPVHYVAELRREIDKAVQKLIDYEVGYYDMTSLGYKKGDLI